MVSIIPRQCGVVYFWEGHWRWLFVTAGGAAQITVVVVTGGAELQEAIHLVDTCSDGVHGGCVCVVVVVRHGKTIIIVTSGELSNR